MMTEKKKTGFRMSLSSYYLPLTSSFRLHSTQRHPVHPYALDVSGPPDLYPQQHSWACAPAQR
jgi:hypothetical protein